MNNPVDNFWVRVSVLLIAVTAPFICLLGAGELPSYSKYWGTDYRPLFIFANAATSYFLFSLKNWRLPAFLLMLVTIFSYDQYLWIHNTTAIAFFITAGYAISKSQKYQFYIIPYVCTLMLLYFSTLLWTEIAAILTICAFHLHRYVRYIQINSSRNNR